MPRATSTLRDTYANRSSALNKPSIMPASSLYSPPLVSPTFDGLVNDRIDMLPRHHFWMTGSDRREIKLKNDSKIWCHMPPELQEKLIREEKVDLEKRNDVRTKFKSLGTYSMKEYQIYQTSKSGSNGNPTLKWELFEVASFLMSSVGDLSTESNWTESEIMQDTSVVVVESRLPTVDFNFSTPSRQTNIEVTEDSILILNQSSD